MILTVTLTRQFSIPERKSRKMMKKATAPISNNTKITTKKLCRNFLHSFYFVLFLKTFKKEIRWWNKEYSDQSA